MALEGQLIVNNNATVEVMAEVQTERWAQDNKWGVQDHDNPLWSLILGEEVGEACQAALQHGADVDTVHDDSYLRRELIQIAAVAVNWVESIDRRTA